MSARHLRRLGRIEADGHGRTLRIGSGCEAGACAGPCGLRRADRRIPLRWVAAGKANVDVGDPAELCIRASGLTRVAFVCFGAPLLALIGAGWLAGAAGTHAGLSGDTLAAMTGLAAAGAVLALVARRGGGLVRLLEVTVQPPGRGT